MHRAVWMALAAVCVCLVSRPLAAQQVRGVVRDSTVNVPLPGAVVSILDSAGKSLVRTIADGFGRFTLARSSTSARVRVIRIGFQPREVPLPRAQGDVTVDVTMIRIPPVITGMRISDRELCPGSADRGIAFQLWEQARAGLLSAVVARDAKPATATTLIYERTTLPTDPLVRRQKTVWRSGRTSRPFVAAETPEAFAKRGYMVEDATDGGRLFYAPDADVLLDEWFATTHCFHMQLPDDAHVGQIGLAFTPAPGRDTLVDVSGVVWIDRATPELKSFDFRYTGLEPAAMHEGVGGHMEFRTVGNGVSFIERWALRLPVMRQAPTVGAAATQRITKSMGPQRRQDRTDLRVSEIQEAGGQVFEAKWDDGTSWTDIPTGVSGTVKERKGDRGAAHALITLEGTTDTTTADGAGRFTLVPLIPGRYSVIATDTSFSGYVAERKDSKVVDVGRGQVVAAELLVTPTAEVLAQICKDQRSGPQTTTLFGHITLPGGGAPRDASIRAVWLADVAFVGGTVAANDRAWTTDVDAAGRFSVCGIALQRPVKLKFTQGLATADTTVMLDNGERNSFTWHVTPRVVSVANEGSVTGVIMRDAPVVPALGAEVSIPSLGLRATTSVDGLFLLAGVPPGSYQLQIRQLGFAPVLDSVKVEPGGTLWKKFTLSHATQLDTVHAVASAQKYISGNLRGFEERRRLGNGGTFIPDSVLRASDNSRLADVLRARASGIQILNDRGGTYAVSSRDSRSGKYAMSGGGSRPGCYVTVYLDGILLFDMETKSQANPAPNLNEYSVNQFAAIEFYGGGAATPAQFKSSECGTLLLWTREK